MFRVLKRRCLGVGERERIAHEWGAPFCFRHVELEAQVQQLSEDVRTMPFIIIV